MLATTSSFSQPPSPGTVASTSASSASSVPSELEMTNFHLKLSQCGHKPGLLSVVSPYSDSYVTNVSTNARPLTDLFNKEHLTFTLAELQTMAEAVNVSISKNDIEEIERNTRGQSTNKNWFLF